MWLDQLCGKYGPAAVFQPGRAGLPLRNGQSDREGNGFREKYTRILIPSFVFILFADIFFIIISLLQGGIFRGWLAKKE